MTPSATPSPTPSATPSSLKWGGLAEIGGFPLDHSFFTYDRQTVKWATANPSDGVFKFDNLKAGAVAAHNKGHKYGISVQSLGTPPDFVIALGAKLYTYKNPKGETLQIMLPFDPVGQPKLMAFVTRLCTDLDGIVDYIQIGEVGHKTESYMPLPSDIGISTANADYIASWVTSSGTYIDIYGKLLKKTPFIMAAGQAFKDPGSQKAVESVLDHGLTYPLFGIGQWGLNANSNDGFFVNAKIKANPTHPNLLQMTGDRHHNTGGDLCGNPAAAGCSEANNLELATAAGRKFMPTGVMEIYSQDGEDPASADTLTQVNTALQ